MGSFVTVSCHDYYFVTIDPSGLNEVQEKRLLIIIKNPKAFSKVLITLSSSPQGDERSGVTPDNTPSYLNN